MSLPDDGIGVMADAIRGQLGQGDPGHRRGVVAGPRVARQIGGPIVEHDVMILNPRRGVAQDRLKRGDQLADRDFDARLLAHLARRGRSQPFA